MFLVQPLSLPAEPVAVVGGTPRFHGTMVENQCSAYCKIRNLTCSFEVYAHIWVENDLFCHELITSVMKFTSFLVSQQRATHTATLCMVTVSGEDHLELSLETRACR